MKNIAIVFMLGMFCMPVPVECSAAASEPLLTKSKLKRAYDFESYHVDPGMEYAPPLPLKEMESVKKIESGSMVVAPPAPKKVLTQEERAKKFIQAVFANDDTAFLSLFHEDPSMRSRLARQRFTLKGVERVTPLHLASKNGNESMVRDLVVHGADVKAKMKDGLTPLVAASKRGHVEVVDYLASLPIQQDYDTSLSVAIQNGHLPVVKTLLDRVVYNHRDLGGALALAQQHGKHDIAQYLLDYKKQPSLAKSSSSLEYLRRGDGVSDDDSGSLGEFSSREWRSASPLPRRPLEDRFDGVGPSLNASHVVDAVI